MKSKFLTLFVILCLLISTTPLIANAAANNTTNTELEDLQNRAAANHVQAAHRKYSAYKALVNGTYIIRHAGKALVYNDNGKLELSSHKPPTRFKLILNKNISGSTIGKDIYYSLRTTDGKYLGVIGKNKERKGMRLQKTVTPYYWRITYAGMTGMKGNIYQYALYIENNKALVASAYDNRKSNGTPIIINEIPSTNVIPNNAKFVFQKVQYTKL